MSYPIRSLTSECRPIPSGSLVRVRRRPDLPCDDAILVRPVANGVGVVVIDGVTSVGQGYKASEMVLFGMVRCPMTDAASISDAFGAIDHDFARTGEEFQASAVGFVVRDGAVYGSSAGDCEAWFIPADGNPPRQLTKDQNRRPRIGDSVAPVEFCETLFPLQGVILAASDGLWVNCIRREVFDIARRETADVLPEVLAAYIYARCGNAFPDDIAIVAITV